MILKRKKLALSISGAVFSGAFVVGGLMQQAQAQEQSTTVTTSAPAAAKADDGSSIARVVITGQSRTQQLQDVPISIEVVNSDQIKKLAANNLADLNGYIPGLSVDASQPTQPGFTMRGVGSSGDFGVGTDSTIAIYVDGVYTGKTGGALMNFNDVERVEVLNGPQGTLFGRNSAIGAISIVTKEPSNEMENEVELRIGNYGERDLKAMLNVPLSDTVALRLNVVGNKSDGWLRDADTGASLNDTGDKGMRASLRWKAPENTKVILSWEYENLNQNARPDIGIVPLSSLTPVPQIPVNPDTYLNPLHAPAYNNMANNVESRIFNGVTLRIEHPMDWATFNSTTAYRHFNSTNLEDNTGNNLPTSFLSTGNYEHNTTEQQEFKLSGKNDMADWLGGISLFSESATQHSTVMSNTDTLDVISLLAAGVPVYSTLDGIAQGYGIPAKTLGNSWVEGMYNTFTAKSYAIYGDSIWHVAPKLNFTTGLRYTYDQKTLSWYNPTRTAPGLDSALATLTAAGVFTDPQTQPLQAFAESNLEYNTAVTTNAPLSMSKSWTNVSPRAVLDYKFTQDVMMFGSITKGYQSGGFNTQVVAQTYNPETVINYEIGLKSYFPDQRLLFNASVFKYNLDNIQNLTLVANSGAAIPQYQVTTSNETATGVDMMTRWQATKELRLNLASEYIDQKYLHDVTPQGVDLSDEATGTPFWQIAAGIDFTQRNVLGGKLNYSLGHTYKGPGRCNATSSAQGTCSATTAFNVSSSQVHTDGRIGWDSGDGTWGVALYGRNLMNNRYVTGIDTTASSTLGAAAATVSEPRTYGIQLHGSL